MQARGHRLLLCAPVASRIFQRAQEAGLSVHALDDRKWTFPFTVARLAGLFRREKVQVVNPHSSRDGWLAGLAARLAGVPLIIRSRHIEVDYPNRGTSRIAFHSLPHHVITTSEKISAGLIKDLGLLPERVTCIATGIDQKKFNPQVNGTLAQELKLSADIPLVGMISVLRSWKGHDYFLAAAQELVQQNVRAHFVVTGEGPRRQWIEQKIQELGLSGKVTLLGHREDVPNILASLSILVLPSTAHEGIPQIILQAQSMGKAVIGTSVGGIPEVVRDGETGLLAALQSGPALAEKITRLLNDPALRQRLGQQALAYAQREYSSERMCERLEALYARYLTTV